MKMITVAFFLVSILLLPSVTFADVAGSVEEGLESLATEIVNKSLAADKKTIAVLPFPNADRSCSVLSTYIVDELILHLFNVPDSPLKIIERSQMEALLSEIKLSAGGLLDPKTTKQLGDISGVQALIIGTITVIGDHIRINARLVETDTARTISAAAISIPKTQAINELLEQAIEGGPMCGMGAAVGAAPVSKTPTSFSIVTPSVGAKNKGSFYSEGLRFFVQNISRAQDSKSVNLVLGVINENKTPLEVIFIRPRASIVDNKGNVMYVKNVVGIQSCDFNRGDWDNDPERCINTRRSSFTTLTSNVLQTVLFRFEMNSRDNGAKFDGDLISFSSRAQVISDEKQKTYKNIPISIPNIATR